MKKLSIAIIALVLAVFVAASADAALRLRVEDVGLGVGAVLTDNAVGDTNPTVGVVSFSGTVGQFSVIVAAGASKPVIGGGINNYAELDLFTLSVNTDGAGSLRLILEDTDYSGGPNGPMLLRSTVGGTLTAPPGSSVTIQSYVDATNAVVALGPDTFPPGAVPALGAIPGTPGFVPPGATFGPGAFSASSNAGWTKAGLYSMTADAVIGFTGAGTVSFDANLQTLPEPTSMLAWGLLSLGGLVYSYRLRKRQG